MPGVYDYIFLLSKWPISQRVKIIAKIDLMAKRLNYRRDINLLRFISVYD